MDLSKTWDLFLFFNTILACIITMETVPPEVWEVNEKNQLSYADDNTHLTKTFLPRDNILLLVFSERFPLL